MKVKMQFIMVLSIYILCLLIHISCFFVVLSPVIYAVIFIPELIALGIWVIDIKITLNKKLIKSSQPILVYIYNHCENLTNVKTWQIISVLLLYVYIFVHSMFMPTYLLKAESIEKNDEYALNLQMHAEEYTSIKKAHLRTYTSYPLLFVGFPLVHFGELARKKKSTKP